MIADGTIIARPAQEDEVAMKLLRTLSIVSRRRWPEFADRGPADRRPAAEGQGRGAQGRGRAEGAGAGRAGDGRRPRRRAAGRPVAPSPSTAPRPPRTRPRTARRPPTPSPQPAPTTAVRAPSSDRTRRDGRRAALDLDAGSWFTLAQMVVGWFADLCVADVGASRAFYAQLLDLTVLVDHGWYVELGVDDRVALALVQRGHETVPAQAWTRAAGRPRLVRGDRRDARWPSAPRPWARPSSSRCGASSASTT